MAFVPSHKHDIFVSYAHVDDLPFPGVDKGWVTTLVETLQILLAQKLGRKEAYSLWMDHQLSRHTDLTPEILDNLGKTATLLVILSPGYVASEWCLREKDTFLKLLGQKQRSGSRVFIVERDKVEWDERPEQFTDLLGYRFWVQEGDGNPPKILGSPWPDPKNAENMAYFDQLTRLGSNLADELKLLREAEASAVPEEVEANPEDRPTDDRPTVFLAQVTDDLDIRSDEMRRYFEQAGLNVLPDTWYSRDPEEFQRQVDRDLARSKVFVQLLSALPGKRPPTLPQGYLRLQYERALEAGLPVVQWRDRKLDPATVDDPEHRAFLQSETVMAVGTEELKRTVVEMATAEPETQEPVAQISEDALVFIDAEAGDLELAEALSERLAARGISTVLPLGSGTPAEVREDFEQNLMFCDALIIVYGQVHAKWVRDQLLVLRKLTWKREQPLRAVAILEGPPEPKDPVRLALPNLTTIDCRQGLDDEALNTFLAGLEQG